MANEAIPIQVAGSNRGNVVRYTVADGIGIEKYTCLKFSGSNIVAASSAAGTTEQFAGIAAEEKVASDGQTSIGVYTCGIFNLCCAAGQPGALYKLSGSNCFTQAAAADILSGAGVRLCGVATATLTPTPCAVGIY